MIKGTAIPVNHQPLDRLHQSPWQRLRHDRWGLIGMAIVAVYGLMATGVWWGWWGTDWSAISADFYAPASWDHWLGTNAIGQDIAARGLFATRVAFEVGLVVAVLATGLGVLMGALAGFFSGTWLDALILWLMGVLDAIPFYLFVAALAYALQGHPLAMHIAMTLTFWTQVGRIIRAEVMVLKHMTFAEAARAMGLRPLHILWRHVLPNTSHLITIQATLVFVAAIKTEVILSFLGLGIQQGISWGLMLSESVNDIQAGYFNNFMAASGLLFILIIAFNFFSDALQDALDPKMNGAHELN